jgi:hypothetical protein
MDAIAGGKAGTDWTDDENDLLVADYSDMLKMNLAGRFDFEKKARYVAMADLIGRSWKSVERKHQNVSTVMLTLGLPRVTGLPPLVHVQAKSLAEAIEHYITNHPEFVDASMPDAPAIKESELFQDPPERSEDPNLRFEPMRRMIRKFDPVPRDARNRALGRRGEEFVVEQEERLLHSAGRRELARAVRWVAREDGDGAGYDVKSFDPLTSSERLIEVKTTYGGKRTPFFLTRNEESPSRERPDAFVPYRLYDFGADPRIFRLHHPLEAAVTLRTESWRASFS